MTTLLTAALELHAAGLSIVPVAADGTKRPRIAWKEYSAAAADQAQLRAWFDNDLAQGIGLVTGFGDVELLEVEGVAMPLMGDVLELLDGTGLRPTDHGQSLVAADGVHPLVAGSDLWAKVAISHFIGNTR